MLLVHKCWYSWLTIKLKEHDGIDKESPCLPNAQLGHSQCNMCKWCKCLRKCLEELFFNQFIVNFIKFILGIGYLQEVQLFIVVCCDNLYERRDSKSAGKVCKILYMYIFKNLTYVVNWFVLYSVQSHIYHACIFSEKLPVCGFHFSFGTLSLVHYLPQHVFTVFIDVEFTTYIYIKMSLIQRVFV